MNHLSDQSDFDAVVHDPKRLWTRSYVAEMESTLGASVCRKMGIYSLPDGFVLTVIVPVYNEAKTVSGVFDRLCETGMPMQIVMVDDGSTELDSASHVYLDSVNQVQEKRRRRNRECMMSSECDRRKEKGARNEGI